ncbi:MarR family transcriptional regulator [Compostibacter hankyongensis]|uniref:HTH marR-type domain-containing protein n=1 Tax=Compostibacter hankyongensis TaxID=1007089 RepID=A0ABP8G5X7_9BACT
MKIEAAIRQTRFTDNYQKMVVNFVYTGNWLRDEQVKIFKAYGILPQHYNALRILKGRYPDPVSPGEIKAVMLDKANDLTRLLDKLVQKEMVQRRLCETNRRKMDVTITPKGLKLIEELEKPLGAFTQTLKKRLTDKEAAQLSRLLDKMRD